MTAALSGLFAACTQEDYLNAPSSTTNDPLAGRPVVGVVDFVTGEPETRYNPETATPDAGDNLGLYLMDEFRGGNDGNTVGELDNANETLWKYQSNWWQMYEPTNNIQSNYGYELQENGKWINRASQLVEGNYMIMFPKNEKATNRRDLWYYINPNVTMEKHSDASKGNYYVNRENQFMLSYKQIYRDQKKDGENLTIDVKLWPILSYAKFVFENVATNPFIAEKIVFKAHEGQPLPTVAYVKPDVREKTWWPVEDLKATYTYQAPGFIADSLQQLVNDKMFEDQIVYDECGEKILGAGLYNDAWFTQGIARSMVHYETTQERVPYGLNDSEATVAYEYVFNFPEGGVRLEGNETSGGDYQKRIATASIALPAFEGWKELEVVVYGKMFDPKVGAWRNGVMRKLGKDNADFKLDQLMLWESGKEIPTATLTFDDQYFYQEEEVRVSTTEDLLKLISARLTSATTTEDIQFNVTAYGNGLEITDDVVSLIKNYTDKQNVEVGVTFSAEQETPIILKAANSINMFNYNGVNVVLEADQTSDEAVRGIKDLNIFNTLTLKADLNVAGTITVEETGVLDVQGGEWDKPAINLDATKIVNENILAFVKNVAVDANIENAKNMSVTGDADLEKETATTVDGNIINSNDCVNCGKEAATLTINENATLTVSGDLTNTDSVINNGTLNVEGTFTNKDYQTKRAGNFTTEGEATIAKLINNRFDSGEVDADNNSIYKDCYIYINGGSVVLTEVNGSVNDGYINIAAGAKLIGTNNDTYSVYIYNQFGTIGNFGTLHQVRNDGFIVTGAGSYTRELNGNGVINNSSKADVVYGAAQTCQYVVDDVTGKKIADLNADIAKAKANQLIIMKGTLAPETDGLSLVGVGGKFSKGVGLGAVAFAGKRLNVYTNTLSVGQPSTIKSGELVIVDLEDNNGALKGATLIVAKTGDLTIEQGATLRGSSDAKLTITNYGTIHNSGNATAIANVDDCKESTNGSHWSGNDATN